MITKVIKDEATYELALKEISFLIESEPVLDAPEADRLELLTVLVEDYELQHFPRRIPDAIEAIRFRMEQQHLSRNDLVRYLGSQSKVSEVLSGKRPLSLSMIRSLHSGLGIPLKALLKEREDEGADDDEIKWDLFPIKEMVSREWIKTDLKNIKDQTEELLKKFFAPIGPPNKIMALYKMTDSIRSARAMDKYALAAWTARIIVVAMSNQSTKDYVPNTVNLDFMREVARLSWSDSGPLLAVEFLEKNGISLVIEPHLRHTHLDGAAIMILTNRPIIGLSIRHDRLDNFWFCLMHELAHIALHYGQETTQFYDDLDIVQSKDSREQEADQLAGEALIPESDWKKSAAKSLRSPEAAQSLASRLRIHPAIVAGRMRHEAKSYRILNQLVGQGQVRKMFKDVLW